MANIRVPVLTPWQHNGEEIEVGSFVVVDEDLVRRLRGTLGQEHVSGPEPELPPKMPAAQPDTNDVRA